MKRIITIIATLALSAAFVAPAQAQNKGGGGSPAGGKSGGVTKFGFSNKPVGKPGDKKGGDPAAQFKKFDTNHDGYISKTEFIAGLGGDKDKALAIFAKLDKNGDDKLSKEEFVGWDQDGGKKKVNQAEQFKKLDTNGDGFISKAEFIAGHPGDKDKALAVFAKLDTNGDGKLSKEEFFAHEGNGNGKDKPNPEEQFKKLDKNGDGSISKEEFVAGHPGDKDKALALFEKLDKDGNGSLSKEEFIGHQDKPVKPGK